MHSAVVVALLLAPAADVPVITPNEARGHAGQEVVVRGQVAQLGASESSDTLFLNFGGRYPDQVFNAVIFRRHFRFFPQARHWEGKIIEVRGKVQLYKGKGKPEIVLERQEQVTVDSSTTPPQGVVPQGMEEGVEGSVLGGVPGRVVRARVIQSVPLLDAAALQTVYQWAFSPAVKHGRPVPTLAHAPISFRIYEKAPRALEQRKQSPATSGKK
jgi:hypothetical protein